MCAIVNTGANEFLCLVSALISAVDESETTKPPQSKGGIIGISVLAIIQML